MTSHQEIVRTAEMVGDGHPDKFCDQVADSILTESVRRDPQSRVAIECLAKNSLLVVSGELTTRADLAAPDVDGIEGIARRVWQNVGYGDGHELTVINYVQRQSSEIAVGVDTGGAGDQGIMVGYATSETPEYLPLEYTLARALAKALRDARLSGSIPWLRSDNKTQVTLAGRTVRSVVVAAQHDASVLDRARNALQEEARETLVSRIIMPVIGPYVDGAPPRITINGTGPFVIGGPHGDAGVVGRKTVVDAYGPSVPVGGGAYSGKDATKVDRSAAYMARHIAKTIVAHRIGNARAATVHLAYAIGQTQPEGISAVTACGKDLSSWVREWFPDLSPAAIIERLQLRTQNTWTYLQTASLGHYGRESFPWEAIAPLT